MPDILTVDVRLLKDAKPVAGLASVSIETELGELTISKVKIIHQDGKNPWVALPEIRYKDDKTGDWKNIPIFTPSAKLKSAITEAVLTKYRELGVAER